MLLVGSHVASAQIDYPVPFIMEHDAETHHGLNGTWDKKFEILPNTSKNIPIGIRAMDHTHMEEVYCVYEVTCDAQRVLRIKNISPEDSPVTCTPQGGPIVVDNVFNIKVRDKVDMSRK